VHHGRQEDPGEELEEEALDLHVHPHHQVKEEQEIGAHQELGDASAEAGPPRVLEDADHQAQGDRAADEGQVEEIKRNRAW
jgi:hypothetical protein